MLPIPFSHRYKKMPTGVDLPQVKTILRGYRVVDKLSPRFIAYDTAIVGGGNFKLPDKGPYLILFLKTRLPLSLQFPGNNPYWTTVMCPWGKTLKGCFNCRYEGHECETSVWMGKKCPAAWMPQELPAKYREARGKEVKIVIKEK